MTKKHGGKMKISTIVPIYNSEKYLKKCIDSIINQSIGFENIQLILVDDGSTDRSKSIIDQYIKKYKNITYIYQKNSGQASARNKGLKVACGEFISFVDSDDYIEKNMYLELYDIAKQKKCDIVTCDYMYIYDMYKKYGSFNFTTNSNRNFIIMNTGPCNMIIRTKVLIDTQFEFPEGIIYEDLAVIPSLGIDSKIFHLEKPLYNYLIRKNSTMNLKKYNLKMEDIFESLDHLYAIFSRKNAQKKYKEELEFLYIRRLMMSASLRFIEFNDPNNCIGRISAEIKGRFPNWKYNKYYKKLPFKQRVVAMLTYKKNKKVLKLLFKLNNRRKI